MGREGGRAKVKKTGREREMKEVKKRKTVRGREKRKRG